MSLLLVFIGGALGFSFLCSILEASFLSARVVALMERRDGGDKGAELLLHLKQQKVDDALSAILILNTVANTAGATLAGAQAETLFGEQIIVFGGFDIPWVGIFTVTLILLILVCSEIIPKTLGAVYAQRMVPFTAYTIRFMVLLFSPALTITRVITGLLAKNRAKEPVSRRELAAMVAAAARDGTLPLADSRVVSNVLRYHEIKVRDVMTPRTVVCMRPDETTIAEFLDDEDCRTFSRIPLYEGENRDGAVGYVLQREVLAAAARGTDRGTPLRRWVRKAHFIPEGQSVAGALSSLTERREPLALVTDEYGGISGLVTLEDLMETTLGIEILDESDRVADLREEAKKLRDRRLKEIESWRRQKAAEQGED